MKTSDPADVLVEYLVDSFEDEPEEWEDVLRRAEVIDAPERASHRRRWRGRALIAALLVVGLAVPAALALLGQWETPKQFIADRSQPAYVRELISEWMNGFETGGRAIPPPGGPERVTALQTVFTANTPDGQARVYVLRFTHGEIGIGAFLTRKSRALALSKFLAAAERCPPGWVLQQLGGGTDLGGGTVGYVIGRASPRVASVHVLYRYGSTTQGAVENGYFLAWMKPAAGRTNVTLIAENARGQAIARLVIRGDGRLPYLPAKRRSLHPCSS